MNHGAACDVALDVNGRQDMCQDSDDTSDSEYVQNREEVLYGASGG